MRQFTIAIAHSRKAKKWQNGTYTLEELHKLIGKIYVTSETAAEYAAMQKSERDEIKDIGGFVGGFLENGRRKKGACDKRSILTLDADNASEDFPEIVEMLLGCCCFIYSTHSYTKKHPRYRLIMPLSRDVNGDEYVFVANKIMELLGIEQFDPTCIEPERLMYYCSHSSDVEPIFISFKGELLDPDKFLNSDWKNASTLDKPIKKQADPREKNNIVGAFCRTYTITEAIETYLADVYTPENNGRYTYIPGHSYGGLVIYEDDLFAYSNHATDPAGAKLLNAFDLVRIHKFGELDDKAKEGTPPGRMPSYLAMIDMALSDEKVKKLRTAEAFGDETDAADYIEVNRNGTAKINVARLADIIANSERLFITSDVSLYYNTNLGVWVNNTNDYLRGLVLTRLGDLATPKLISDTVILVNDIIKQRLQNKKFPDSDLHKIVLDGGVYDVRTETYKLGYDSMIYATTKHPIEYDAEAKSPLFDGFISALYGEECLPLMYEWIGFCFWRKYEPQRILFLCGEGGSGKSSTIEIIRHVIGANASSNVSLKLLKDSQFSAAGLFGKCVNFDSDAKREYLADADFLKSLTGDLISADVKYGNPLTFYNYAKLVFAMNYQPRVNDSGGGFARRAIIINSKNIVTEALKEQYPLKAIKEERAGIFNNAMKGLKRVLAKTDIELPDSVLEVLHEHELNNDSVLRFFEDQNLSGFITTRDLYEMYRQYIYDDEDGSTPISIISFGIRVGILKRRLGCQNIVKKIDKKSVKGWFFNEKCL